MANFICSLGDGIADIARWYLEHKERCPHCGVNLGQMHESVNLYPHFTGACVPQGAH